MSATESVSIRPVPMEVQKISLDRIQESTGNPRRIFDEAKLLELAENIKLHGVLQPILLRRVPPPRPGQPDTGSEGNRACNKSCNNSAARENRSDKDPGQPQSNQWCGRRESNPHSVAGTGS